VDLGTARADPTGRTLAGCADNQIDGSADIGALLILSEIDRNHVHGVGMRHDVMARMGYLAHDFGVPLRHDPGDDHRRVDALACQRVEHAKDAAAVAIFGKSDGIEIRHAGLERIAHGTDAWPSKAQRKNTASRLPPGQRKSAGKAVSVAPT
jgi:hypothetical protein